MEETRTKKKKEETKNSMNNIQLAIEVAKYDITHSDNNYIQLAVDVAAEHYKLSFDEKTALIDTVVDDLLDLANASTVELLTLYKRAVVSGMFLTVDIKDGPDYLGRPINISRNFIMRTIEQEIILRCKK